MADVGISRLVAVEGLARADCRGPEADPERIAHVRSERVPAVPDVEDEEQDQYQAGPAHRRAFLSSFEDRNRAVNRSLIGTR